MNSFKWDMNAGINIDEISRFYNKCLRKFILNRFLREISNQYTFNVGRLAFLIFFKLYFPGNQNQ